VAVRQKGRIAPDQRSQRIAQIPRFVVIPFAISNVFIAAAQVWTSKATLSIIVIRYHQSCSTDRHRRLGQPVRDLAPVHMNGFHEEATSNQDRRRVANFLLPARALA